jgi:hypothetical protein
MWTYPDVGDSGCEVSRSLAMESTKSLSIEISTRHINRLQKVRVVTRWLDINRGYREYILMGVG